MVTESANTPQGRILVATAHAQWHQATWRSAPSRALLRAALPAAAIPAPSTTTHPDSSLLVQRVSSTGDGWAESPPRALRPDDRTADDTIWLARTGDRVDLGLEAQHWTAPRRDRRWLTRLEPGHAVEVSINHRRPSKASGGPTVYVDQVTLVAWTTDQPPSTVDQILDSVELHRIDLRKVLY